MREGKCVFTSSPSLPFTVGGSLWKALGGWPAFLNFLESCDDTEVLEVALSSDWIHNLLLGAL